MSQSRKTNVRHYLIAIALLGSCSPTFALAADDAATIAEVLRAWSNRQASAKSLRATWAVARHREAGSHAGKEMREGVFPPTAFDTKLKFLLLLDGDYWRSEEDGRDWSNVVEDIIPQQMIRTYNGGQFRTFRGVKYRDPNELHDVGHIMRPDRSVSTTSYPWLAPVLAHYRPLAPTYGHFAPETWRPKGPVGRGVAKEQECLIIEFVHAGNPREIKQCWVAPRLDHSIIRLILGSVVQLDIEYRVDPQHGPVPKAWQYSQLSPKNNAVEVTDNAVVESFDLNPEIDSALLAVEFPVGTEVIDSTQPGRPISSYLVRPGGEKRAIARDERMLRVPYKELLQTETGERQVKSVVPYGYYWGVGLATLVVAGMAFWAFARRSRNQ